LLNPMLDYGYQGVGVRSQVFAFMRTWVVT
jgi:hypothetical protein